MKLTVHSSTRFAKMRAHTATHLLHFALDKMLQGTKQAGSLVDNDYLRFDFACKKPLSSGELLLLESSINAWIQAGFEVITEEMTMKDAQKTGAKAFFEDKYGDTVRVVQIRGEVADELDLHSIELCGGIHVLNTASIGACKIIEHSAVASGIRRIVAVTGTKVVEEAQKNETRLLDIATRLDCQPKQLEDKLEKILSEYKHLQSDMASLEGKIICTHLDELSKIEPCKLPLPSGEGWGEGCIINTTSTELEHHSFKEIVNAAKSRRSDRNRIIYNTEGNFAIYTGIGDFSAKTFAKDQGLKGGGSDQFFQGKDEKILEVV